MALKKDLLSHHDFQKIVALSWIKRDSKKFKIKQATNKNKKRKASEMESSMLPLTIDFLSITSSPSKQGKCLRATECSFNQTTWLLRHCLDSTLDHLPELAKRNLHYSLHCMVGFKTEKEIACCTDYIVNLLHLLLAVLL